MTTPFEFLRACILLILHRSANYGYRIEKELNDMGFSPAAPRTYRVLRVMEHDGLVASSWVKSPEGPRRRGYVLTEDGGRELAKLTADVRALHTKTGKFLEEAP